MSVMDKLKFWKHEDDFTRSLDGIDSPGFSDSNMGLGDQGQTDRLGLPRDQGFSGMNSWNDSSPQAFGSNHGSYDRVNPNDMGTGRINYPNLDSSSQPAHPDIQKTKDYAMEKSLEVISSKLDALKAAIESINQRLSNIERIASQEDQERRNRRPNW